MRHSWRPALYPTRTLHIVVDAIAVRVMRRLKLPCLYDSIFVVPQKPDIATVLDVVEHRHQEERSRIGGSIHIRQRTPIDKRRGLRILVHDLAIISLSPNEKLQLLTRKRKIPEAIHRIQRIQRIPPEEPPKTGSS